MNFKCQNFKRFVFTHVALESPNGRSKFGFELMSFKDLWLARIVYTTAKFLTHFLNVLMAVLHLDEVNVHVTPLRIVVRYTTEGIV